MANELPYFRFTVSAWQNGKIALERYELQGLFISICGFYWMQDCSITMAMLQKRFSNATPMLIQELVDLNIMKHEKRHDKIEIEFLNIQFDLLSEKRKRRQGAGSKGGNAKAMLKQKGSYKDKDKDKDKDKEIPPPKISNLEFFKQSTAFKEKAIKAAKVYGYAFNLDTIISAAEKHDALFVMGNEDATKIKWMQHFVYYFENLRKNEGKAKMNNEDAPKVDTKQNYINLPE